MSSATQHNGTVRSATNPNLHTHARASEEAAPQKACPKLAGSVFCELDHGRADAVFNATGQIEMLLSHCKDLLLPQTDWDFADSNHTVAVSLFMRIKALNSAIMSAVCDERLSTAELAKVVNEGLAYERGDDE